MSANADHAIKLFYSPGACSLAPHIALEEAGAHFTPTPVDFKSSEQRSPTYLKINPKGRVPALAIGEVPGTGWTLTENPAILQFIALSHPDASLWPTDLHAQAKCLEWMAWLSSGVHVTYAHVRRAERYATSEAALADVRAKGAISTREIWGDVETRMAAMAESGAGPWIAGDQFTVVDGYAFVFWMWGAGQHLGYDMAKEFPAWTAHARRMAARPAVQRVLAREGLVAKV
jgi:glutathione S-transferase